MRWKFRKLVKHPLDVESYNPKTGLRLKIYYRELVRERTMFIGMGVAIGAAVSFGVSLLAGVESQLVGPAFVITTTAGTILAILQCRANPYGDLR